MTIDNLRDFDSKVAEIEKADLPWLKEPLKKLFEAMRLRIKLNQDRDSEVAKALVGMQRSGVHFAGLNHLRNTVRNLEVLCEQESTARQKQAQTRK